MLRRNLKIVALLTLTVAGALGALAMAGPQAPRCIKSWPEVRYRNYGYDHIVHLSNECRVLAICSVSSDVSPNAIEIRIAAGEQAEVMTSRGSPAREFVPRVECRFVT